MHWLCPHNADQRDPPVVGIPNFSFLKEELNNFHVINYGIFVAVWIQTPFTLWCALALEIEGTARYDNYWSSAKAQKIITSTMICFTLLKCPFCFCLYQVTVSSWQTLTPRTSGSEVSVFGFVRESLVLNCRDATGCSVSLKEMIQLYNSSIPCRLVTSSFDISWPHTIRWL